MAYSVVNYVGDGSTVQYAVNFTNGIFSRDSVFVFLEGEEDGAGDPIARDFIWINDGLIEIQGNAPLVDQLITIRRILDASEPAVDYNDGEILTEENMDTSLDHLLGLIHTLLDGYGFEDGLQTDLDMNGFRITDLGAPVDANDAVRLQDVAIVDDGDLIVVPQEESVVLISGQLEVTFNEYGVLGASFFINGYGVDDARLLPSQYTSLDDSTIRLNESYPEGTVLRLIRNEQVASDLDSARVSYTAPFLNNVPRTVEDKLAERVSVKEFGAVGDDSTLSGAAINAAISAVKATGGTVHAPTGVYLCEEPIIIPANVLLVGDGAESTFLKRPNSTSYSGVDSVVKTEGFDTFTGTADGQQSNGVPTGFGMDDISVDGNRFNGNDVTSKHNIRFYGKRYYVGIVISIRAGGTGFYSECANFSNTGYLEDPEQNVEFLRVAQCGDNGIEYTGPNDGYIDKAIVERCGGIGYFSHSLTNTNAKHTVGKLHVYSCGYGIRNDDGIEYADELIAETSTVGEDILWSQFRSQINKMHTYGGLAGYGGASINISGNQNKISSLRMNGVGASTALIVSGDANDIECKIQGSHAHVGTVVGLNLTGNRNRVRGEINDFINAGAKGLLTAAGGTVQNSTIDLNLQGNDIGWQQNAGGTADNVITVNYSSNVSDFSGTPPAASDTVNEKGVNQHNNQEGFVTLVSGFATVSLPKAQPDTNYNLFLTGGANETFWFSARTASGFNINSSNVASTATVFWRVSTSTGI